MEFFEKYTSNTIAGSGNQSFFYSEDSEKVTKSRTFYKILSGGEYNYSFLFSNIIDSTFSDGTHSHKNIVCDSWAITEAKVGVVPTCSMQTMAEPEVMYSITFGGKKEKNVNPGEFFNTDPVCLSPKDGEFLCLEISFRGGMIPNHEESRLATFVWEGDKWVHSVKHPFASMVGCDRPVKRKIAFLGDSITQGIGVRYNSYAHWNAIVAERLGKENAYWNLGLGYGRADDAAADGAWLYKAKQNDIVVVCFGVNDLSRHPKEQIKKNLEKIIDILHAKGIKVILQSVPPFDYKGEYIAIWHEINDYVRGVLAQKADMFFDCADILKKSEAEPHMAPYGGHPNEAGCALWGEALAKAMAEYLSK